MGRSGDGEGNGKGNGEGDGEGFGAVSSDSALTSWQSSAGGGKADTRTVEVATRRACRRDAQVRVPLRPSGVAHPAHMRLYRIGPSELGYLKIRRAVAQFG